MNPLNPQHVIRLFLNRGIEGYYLNGHPELVEWLHNHPLKDYYIQLLPDELNEISFNNCRIWSSEEAMIEAKKRKAAAVEPREWKNEILLEVETEEPLVTALYEACSRKDFVRILELKQKLRSLGIRYDKEKTKIRNLI